MKGMKEKNSSVDMRYKNIYIYISVWTYIDANLWKVSGPWESG